MNVSLMVMRKNRRGGLDTLGEQPMEELGHSVLWALIGDVWGVTDRIQAHMGSDEQERLSNGVSLQLRRMTGAERRGSAADVLTAMLDLLEVARQNPGCIVMFVED